MRNNVIFTSLNIIFLHMKKYWPYYAIVAAVVAIVAIVYALSDRPKSPRYLVLYYSESGNTYKVASTLADLLGDSYSMDMIIPTDPYGDTYEAVVERALEERTSGRLPEIYPVESNLDDYDAIFLCYPVWFGTYALPVASFLESVNLSGKKVVPICTFGSGGLESSVRDLKAAQPGCEVLPGFGIRAARLDAAEKELKGFLGTNGFIDYAVEEIEDFGPVHAVSGEESGIFDAAVGDYPMLNAKADSVSSRPVTGGIEYQFLASDFPRAADSPSEPRRIRVDVLCEDGKPPVFTRVVR